ncbi:hypothetical protein [Endozoicomonas sp. GU-1]|uniref:hypothetical protein n=1 Tax=Endozoicomonas sp. GU-1 TaxID=3009078 RepID=UPI0022B2B94A|nr:hypothetical protein [Endozoicomonas sp. GU-1]WBA79678.1 hypothetical protein O2T12_15025 [Endozoicomonas sp. GU-1]WBA87262.1 hypothetical protein O3276_04295 [Endozoicomonas sp. GU-1]
MLITGNDNDLYLRTLYSEFKDTELRDRVTMAFAGGLAEGVTGALDGGEAQRELKDREEIQQIVSAVVGGSSRHREWTMEYSASFSHAE